MRLLSSYYWRPTALLRKSLILPSFALAGFSLSRKHSLATFVYERLKYTFSKQSPLKSTTDWLCMDVDWYKIVNVYKPPPTRQQASDLPAFPHPCLFAGDFNCPHADWGYGTNSVNGECLASWASINNLAFLYNPNDPASFHSGRWNSGTNPDLVFASADLDSRLPDRRTLKKFPKSQHRPSLITPPKFALPVPSMPVKRWNFRKAKWSHHIALTNKFAKILLLPDSRDFCNIISSAAKRSISRDRRNNHLRCWDSECENLYRVVLRSDETTPADMRQLCSLGSTRNIGADGLKQFRASTFHTPFVKHGVSRITLPAGHDTPLVTAPS